MRQQIEAAGLADRVSLPGFSKDRGEVLQSLRDADLFLFCHKTPESPRCLIEALISGTPIVGYDGAFARELTETNGGGTLVALDDVDSLAAAVIRIGQDKAELKQLIERAAKDGAPFDDETVFRHRCELIRKYL
jgi:glycosyltransferase involved in cell wall biosynthesis